MIKENAVRAAPVAAYVGGKRILSKRLCALIDAAPDVRTYCEPFVGMGGVFLRRTTRPTSEVINDYSRDVATLFRVLQRHYVAFLDMLRFQVTSRAGFERLIAIDPDTQTDLERAARFLYLQRLAFGGKVVGQHFGVDPVSSAGFDLTKLAPQLEGLHERLAGVTIECLPWAEFIVRYDRTGTFYYLDPPYWGTEHFYGKDKFDRAHFAEMAGVLGKLKGRFIMTLNDCNGVRDTFAAFPMKPVTLKYTVGGGGAAKDVQELVIASAPELLIGL